MNLKDKIKNSLFPNNEEIDYDDDDIEVSDVKEKDIVKGGSKMVLVEPRAFSESQQIADNLKRKNSVVVNLKRVTSDQAKRIIDFLSGTLYAINGDMQRLGNGIYLCTPKNVDVEGRISDEDDKKGKKKIEDEIDDF
jgi:cell division inhibitor SepF